MPPFRLCAALAAMVLASGCADPAAPPHDARPDPDGVLAPSAPPLIDAVAYDVISIDGQLVPDAFGAGFTIRDGVLEGSDGCNGISGPVSQTGDTLRIGPLVSTRMACPARIMDPATALNRALAQVNGARPGPGGIVALTADGRDRVIVQAQRS